MSQTRASDGFPKRMLWSLALKLVLMVFATAVALRLYGLI